MVGKISDHHAPPSLNGNSIWSFVYVVMSFWRNFFLFYLNNHKEVCRCTSHTFEREIQCFILVHFTMFRASEVEARYISWLVKLAITMTFYQNLIFVSKQLW
jgi:hypothetical protein